MPYSVNYTDRENKTPITVFDNTSNNSTSLTFPGRKVSGYGQSIAENFLGLLENFASPSAPVNPTEGQLWFNNDPSTSLLLIWDGVSWKSASGVQKGATRPSVLQSKIGELWVDTVNQQLYIFSGTDWILVGPNFSTGLRSGLSTEQLTDSEDNLHIVISFYVEDKPILFISKDTFTPKLIIPQFPVINSGITIASPNINSTVETSIYQGGNLPKLYGSAKTADALTINNQIIDASKFLRSDSVNVVNTALKIKDNSGITVGVDGTFSISTGGTFVKFYNSSPGSSIDFQTTNETSIVSVLRLSNDKVGINNLSPTENLDVIGTARIAGIVKITDTTQTVNVGSGALQVSGGLSVAKNSLINGTLTVSDRSYVNDVTPQINDLSNLGTISKRWNTIYTKTIIADSIYGVLAGSISGNANTATSLQQQTTFSLTGDITAPSFTFNGVTGGLTKTFNTSISPTLITSKQDITALQSPNKAYSQSSDYVLVYRPSLSGLVKASRDTFVGDLGIPIGTILPFAGSAVPFGFLLCDGSEILISQYNSLFQIIGTAYNTGTLIGTNTFKLPDLRGRFPAGKDNMDNGLQLQTSSGSVDAGGGNVDRIEGVTADTLGGVGGNSKYTMDVSSLPAHEHTLKGSSGQQYYAVRSDTSAPTDVSAVTGKGGATINQKQYLPTSGNVKSAILGQPYAVINPYLTINYIIRTGSPDF